MNKENYKPMTQEQSELVIKIAMMQKEPSYENFEKAIEGDFASSLIMRVKAFKLPKFEPTAIMFLSIICTSPGELVLAMVETMEKYDEMKPNKIDFNFIGECVYPWGFHSEESFAKEYGKRRYDNECKCGKYNYLF